MLNRKQTELIDCMTNILHEKLCECDRFECDIQDEIQDTLINNPICLISNQTI